MVAHTGTKSLDDSVNVLRFDTVDDEIAATRHKMTALHNLNIRLVSSQHDPLCEVLCI